MKNQINVSIGEIHIARLKRIAKKRHTSVTQVVRDLIDEHKTTKNKEK